MKSPPGAVADLVRRGQFRYDRRVISRPLKYEDPFNNPLIKTGKRDSTLEMCGKVYRLAPTTLTKEQQDDMHKRRRSRSYQWKRPTMFLKEGDPVPADVDPDTFRTRKLDKLVIDRGSAKNFDRPYNKDHSMVHRRTSSAPPRQTNEVLLYQENIAAVGCQL